MKCFKFLLFVLFSVSTVYGSSLEQAKNNYEYVSGGPLKVQRISNQDIVEITHENIRMFCAAPRFYQKEIEKLQRNLDQNVTSEGDHKSAYLKNRELFKYVDGNITVKNTKEKVTITINSENARLFISKFTYFRDLYKKLNGQQNNNLQPNLNNRQPNLNNSGRIIPQQNQIIEEEIVPQQNLLGNLIGIPNMSKEALPAQTKILG